MSKSTAHVSSTSRLPERSVTAASQTRVSAEVIAKRAYEKFLERSCTHGRDQEDWIAAEQELIVEANR